MHLIEAPSQLPKARYLKEILLGFHNASCALNRHSENVVVKAVIIAELKFSDIEVKVLFADIMEGADDAPLEDAPEALNRDGVNRANHILPMGMIDSDVRESLFQIPVARPLIGAEQANLVRTASLTNASKVTALTF